MVRNKEIIKIESEIKKEIKSLIRGCEILDMELAFKVFSRSPDFFVIASDGDFYDFQTFYDMNKDYLSSCSKFELYTQRLEVEVLTEDLAMVSWLYKAIATLESGGREIWEKAAASFLFKRLKNDWIVINYQESAPPPEKLP